MNDRDPTSEESLGLNSDQELQLQQLLQLRLWQQKAAIRVADHTSPHISPETIIPSRWELIRGITLHGWQERCVDAWFANQKRGVIKVVTGAGKTLLALAIAERLQQTQAPELRVAVIVPTIVLMNQWRDELTARSNLPPDAISFLGGDYDAAINDRPRVLICVLNSAANKLPQIVDRIGVANNLLLIVDECNRAGEAQMRRIFQTKRAYSLGLSASDATDFFTSVCPW